MAAGLPGTNVLDYYGSSMGGPGVTTQIIQFLQKYELPADVIAVAAYGNVGLTTASNAMLTQVG